MALSEASKGILACVTAAFLWALNGVACKFLMRDGLSPFWIAQGRATLGALMVLGYMAFRRPRDLRIKWRHVLAFALLGGVGVAGGNGTYLATIERIPVVIGLLIQYLALAVVALYAWRFRGEPMTRLKVWALVLCLAGCFFLVGGYDLDLFRLNQAGLAWGLAGLVSFAFYCLLNETMVRLYSPLTVLTYALTFAALTWNALLAPANLLRLGHDAVSWFWIFYAAVLGTVVPFGLFTWGMGRLRATKATIASTAEPLFGALIAYLWLGEVLAPLQIVGGLGIVAAIVMIQQAREPRRA